MGMKVSPKQVEAVSKLPAPKRYSHFIKVVADWRQVWGLYDDGWAMSETDDGQMVFPLWPAKEYAEACAVGGWSAYKARPIDLDDFVNGLLPKLKETGVLPGVFYTLDQGSVDASIEQIFKDLNEELSKYE
jgi:hypothetical protein